MTDERKKDAREKISLGGLIVKAGLREADRAYLLGVLLEAAMIRTGSPEHHRLKAKGGMAFQSDRFKEAGERSSSPAGTANPAKTTGG